MNTATAVAPDNALASAERLAAAGLQQDAARAIAQEISARTDNAIAAAERLAAAGLQQDAAHAIAQEISAHSAAAPASASPAAASATPAAAPPAVAAASAPAAPVAAPPKNAIAVVRRLVAAGLQQSVAEAIAEEIFNLIPADVATKADLQEVKNNLQALQTDVATKADLQALQTDVATKADLQAVKDDVQALKVGVARTDTKVNILVAINIGIILALLFRD